MPPVDPWPSNRRQAFRSRTTFGRYISTDRTGRCPGANSTRNRSLAALTVNHIVLLDTAHPVSKPMKRAPCGGAFPFSRGNFIRESSYTTDKNNALAKSPPHWAALRHRIDGPVGQTALLWHEPVAPEIWNKDTGPGLYGWEAWAAPRLYLEQ